MPYCVYVLTNNKGTLYTGVTNNLERRMYEHKHGLVDGFTRKYKVARFLYYEGSDDVRSAIGRGRAKNWGGGPPPGARGRCGPAGASGRRARASPCRGRSRASANNLGQCVPP